MGAQRKGPKKESLQGMLPIKEEHIEGGLRGVSSHCIGVQAIRAALPGARYIDVNIQLIRYSIGESRYTFATPPSLQALIINWDAGFKPEPTTVRIGPPLHKTAAKPAERGPRTVTVVPPPKSRRQTETPKVISEGGDPLPRLRLGRTTRQFGAKNLAISARLTEPVKVV